MGQKKEVVVYRLLTTNSVEIMMMERQISKKKLERLTIQGGDFRKAGERSHDTQLSLNKLRKLLEDDVKDLNVKRGSGINFAGVGTCDNEDITEEELNMIMDRDRLFRTISTSTSTSTSIAVETENKDASIERLDPMQSPIPTTIGATGSCTAISISNKKRKREDEMSDSDLIPTEGRMYDIISMEQFTMQSVS